MEEMWMIIVWSGPMKNRVHLLYVRSAYHFIWSHMHARKIHPVRGTRCTRKKFGSWGFPRKLEFFFLASLSWSSTMQREPKMKRGNCGEELLCPWDACWKYIYPTYKSLTVHVVKNSVVLRSFKFLLTVLDRERKLSLVGSGIGLTRNN